MSADESDSGDAGAVDHRHGLGRKVAATIGEVAYPTMLSFPI